MNDADCIQFAYVSKVFDVDKLNFTVPKQKQYINDWQNDQYLIQL